MQVVKLLGGGLLYSAFAEEFVAYVGGSEVLVDTLRSSIETNWTILSSAQQPSADELATVDFYVPGDVHDDLSQYPRCKVFQLPYTGYDRLNLTSIPATWTVAIVHQAASPIAEYVLRNMLEWNINQNKIEADFRACTWRDAAPGNSCPSFGLHKEISGQTLGIVGYGHIGAAIATRAAAFGVNVIAVDVYPQDPAPAPLSWLGDDSQLPKLMEESDFVVLAVPLLPSTRGMVNASNLKHMANSSVLINIARGPVVDEDALHQALTTKQIGGAVLDVWWHDWEWLYPGEVGPSGWPSSYDFSQLDNVIMTPHMSASSVQARQEAGRQIAKNMDHLFRGEVLDNVIRNATTRSTIV